MNAIVETKRDVWIHGYLLHTAKCLLEKGQEKEAGCHHQFIASLMFSAFGFEAYLNWLGGELDPTWEAKERSFKSEEKLRRLERQLCIKIDRSCRPGKTLALLFRFRNTIAHGKRSPEKPVIKKTFESRYSTTPVPELIKTDWEMFSDPSNVEQVNGDVRRIIEILHASSGLDCGPFSFGSQTRSALLIPEGYRHTYVRLPSPELLKEERKSYEADGWKFYKPTYSSSEGFGAIFVKALGQRNRRPKPQPPAELQAD